MKVPGATRILERVSETLSHAPADGKNGGGSTNGRHTSPRFRAFGRARVELAQRVQSQADWDALWKGPANPFPFAWGASWKQSIEYRVDDFAAEAGFLIDGLGLPVVAFSPEYGIFTSPGSDFCFSVAAAAPGERSTPPEAIRIQFMLGNLLEAAAELERRGVCFEQKPQPAASGSSTWVAYFRTPHGICVDLWGEVDAPPKSELPVETVNEPEASTPAETWPEPDPVAATVTQPSAVEERETSVSPARPFELASLDWDDDDEEDAGEAAGEIEAPAAIDLAPYAEGEAEPEEDEIGPSIQAAAQSEAATRREATALSEERPRRQVKAWANIQMDFPSAISEQAQETDNEAEPDPSHEAEAEKIGDEEPQYEDIEDTVEYEHLEGGDAEGEDYSL